MSLLLDLLSKIKHREVRKTVSPGLQDNMMALKRGSLSRRRVGLLVVPCLVVVSIAVYFFLPGPIPGRSIPADKAVGEEGEGVFRALSPSEAEVRNKTEERPAEVRPALSTSGSAPEKTPAKYRVSGKSARSKPGKREPRKKHPAATSPRRPATVPGGTPDVAPGKVDFMRELTRAASYLDMGDLYSAIAVYRRVVEADPRNYRLMNKIAFLYIKLNEPEKALEYLERGLDIKGDYVPLLINIGIACIKLNRLDEGEVYLLKALRKEGNDSSALLNLAFLYERKGNREKALNYFRILKGLGDSKGMKGSNAPDRWPWPSR